jgi:hypothetical protein
VQSIDSILALISWAIGVLFRKYLQLGELKSFTLQSEMRLGCPLFPLIQYSTGMPSHSSKARERNKRYSNRQRRSQIIPISDFISNYRKEDEGRIKALIEALYAVESS